MPRGLRYLLRALSLAAFLGLWQVLTACRVHAWVHFEQLPTVVQVAKEFGHRVQTGTYWHDLGDSLERILTGFALAAVLGVAVGTAIGRSRLAEDLLGPVVELLRPIPAIALVPVAILVFPSNEQGIVFITFSAAFFPVLVSTRHAVRALAPVWEEAMLTMGGGRLRVLRQVVLPGALPGIFGGLSVGIGVAWICVISAEMISGQFGVGYRTWQDYTVVDYPGVLVGMVTIGLLGQVTSSAVELVGRRATRWLPRSQAGERVARQRAPWSARKRGADEGAAARSRTGGTVAPGGAGVGMRTGGAGVGVRASGAGVGPRTAGAAPRSGAGAPRTPAGEGARLALHGAGIGRAGAPVLTGLDLEIVPGEVLAVVGASGCGKSTLLRTLAGLLPVLGGELAQDGSPLTGPGGGRVIVFQEDGLLPWRTARANVELPLAIAGVGRTERRERAERWLAEVGLAGCEDRLPHRLSGGQRQRVQLARALAGEPRALLMDEPFGALDAQTRAGMQQLLVDVLRSTRATVVFVTHDVDEAVFLGDRVALLGPDGPHGSPVRIVDVPRPRDRAAHDSPQSAALRRGLLEALGARTGHGTPAPADVPDVPDASREPGPRASTRAPDRTEPGAPRPEPVTTPATVPRSEVDEVKWAK
jgi:ABC-type nitrate/sulfonate/bicarbonate transport system ATPase subunit/ABC-type nitrate/sulfonate/bicarbonate transport system permease component